MKIIGHRGARGLAPENTIASLEKALQHHVDEIEFDVRVTKDGVAILNHDPTASDPAGDRLVIKDTTFAELKAHKPDITLLFDALTQIEARVPVLVEVKPGEAIAPIVAVLQEFLDSGMYKPSNMSLGSFSQKTLLELHRALPEIPTVVIERWSGVKARYRTQQLGTKRISMKHIWLWVGFLAPMFYAGYQISPYTMNDPKKVRRWKKYLYGVITDFPDRFEK